MTVPGNERAAVMAHKKGLILYHRNFRVCSSTHNPLDLIERDLIGVSIIEARRTEGIMSPGASFYRVSLSPPRNCQRLTIYVIVSLLIDSTGEL